MSASLPELQRAVDDLLILMGTRLMVGQIVVHVSDGGIVQKVEINSVLRPIKQMEKQRA